MIHILFHNTLFLDVTRYKQVFVSPELSIVFTDNIPGVAHDIILKVLDHPTVKTIIDSLPEEKKQDTSVAIAYQVFNMLCQRFTGKSLVDGVLIPIENDVLNLDGALRNLRVNEEEKKDGEGNK